MAAHVTTDLKTPVEQHFRAAVNSTSHVDVIYQLKDKLTRRQLKLLKKTCFGHFLDMHSLKFSGQIVHSLLLQEVITHGLHHELWFLVSGAHLRFSVMEFGLIMGLRFGGSTTRSEQFDGYRLRDKYFQGRRSIGMDDLTQTILNLDFRGTDDEDVVKLALLLIGERFVWTTHRRQADQWLMQFVDHLHEFNHYPWGTISWDLTFNSLKNALRGRAEKVQHDKALNPQRAREKYHLVGIPLAFQVWCYEAIPSIRKYFGMLVDESAFPFILRWQSLQGPNYTTMSAVLEVGNDAPVWQLQPPLLLRRSMQRCVQRLTDFRQSTIGFSEDLIQIGDSVLTGNSHAPPQETEDVDDVADNVPTVLSGGMVSYTPNMQHHEVDHNFEALQGQGSSPTAQPPPNIVQREIEEVHHHHVGSSHVSVWGSGIYDRFAQFQQTVENMVREQNDFRADILQRFTEFETRQAAKNYEFEQRQTEFESRLAEKHTQFEQRQANFDARLVEKNTKFEQRWSEDRTRQEEIIRRQEEMGKVQVDVLDQLKLIIAALSNRQRDEPMV